MTTSSDKDGPFFRVVSSPLFLVTMLACLTLLVRYQAHAILLPKDADDWLAVLGWAVCLIATGVSILSVFVRLDNPRYRVANGVRLIVGSVVAASGVALLVADFLMIRRRSHLGETLDWYVSLALGVLLVLAVAFGDRIKNRKLREFLVGDPWWVRRRKKRQSR